MPINHTRIISQQRRRLGVVITGCTLMGCMVARRVTKLLESTSNIDDIDNNDDEEEAELIQDHQKLSPSFMNRLAKKPYLDASQQGTTTRPPAVPQTLRLMTVDLTAVREKGLLDNSDCQAVWDGLPHGIAAPKRVLVSSERGGEAPINIEQKVWVRAFHQCYHNASSKRTKDVGIEIMEADTTSLNPSNLRRMHSLIRYDHGKYVKRKRSKPKQGNEEGEDEPVEDLEDVDPQEAPWNQQAWIEEVILRIGGKVKFGEPMQAPKYQWWNRWRKSSGTLLSLYSASCNSELVGSINLQRRPRRNGWSCTKQGFSVELGIRETSCGYSERCRIATYAPGIKTFTTSLQRQRCATVRVTRP